MQQYGNANSRKQATDQLEAVEKPCGCGSSKTDLGRTGRNRKRRPNQRPGHIVRNRCPTVRPLWASCPSGAMALGWLMPGMERDTTGVESDAIATALALGAASFSDVASSPMRTCTPVCTSSLRYQVLSSETSHLKWTVVARSTARSATASSRSPDPRGTLGSRGSTRTATSGQESCSSRPSAARTGSPSPMGAVPARRAGWQGGPRRGTDHCRVMAAPSSRSCS